MEESALVQAFFLLQCAPRGTSLSESPPARLPHDIISFDFNLSSVLLTQSATPFSFHIIVYPGIIPIIRLPPLAGPTSNRVPNCGWENIVFKHGRVEI